jgi:ribosomal protein L11 methyltransferase
METKPQGNSIPPIVLDPGVVFGSGTHPTTRDCLKALDFLLYEERIESAIDLGTGSGLLALGAARLGVDKIIAIDNNPLSVITARKNVAANKMEGAILVVRGRAEDFIDCALDLVIANIHFDVMKRLLRSEGFFQKKWFIISGLLKGEARAVAEGLFSHHAEIIESWIHEGMWHTYLGKNGSKSFQFHFNKGKG